MQPTPLPATVCATPRDARVRADVADLLRRNDPIQNLANLTVAAAMAYSFRTSAPAAWVAAWLGLMLANGAGNAWAAWRSWAVPTTATNTAMRLRASTRRAAIYGLLWMAGVMLMFPGGDQQHRLVMILFLSGLTSGALYSLCAHLPALFAFLLPCTVGFLATVLLNGGPSRAGIAALSLGWFASNLLFAKLMHQTLLDSLRHRHDAASLAADLQVQKDRAVALGQSRSRFLASASHDLRQPVHALSLFVGALSQQPPAAEAQRLLGHMQDTVDAMGAMFNALLDLSKLDANIVTPARRAVPLRPLLVRVCAAEDALARAKGLTLRCDVRGPDDLALHTDPVLLERVLHNLVGNAVRYTREGQVQVVADVQAGQARIRVADSGVGIAADQRVHVFQEFVQLHNPERDRSQGLGLGLAIVQRLCGLLDLRLVLRSRPGRGTVFSLRVPIASHVAVEPPASRDAVAAHSLLPGDVVLVIDDAAEIRLATAALLSGRGCRVLAADSLAGLTPQLLALTTQPRLIICDHRLRDGDNGAAVIEQLRAGFNDEVAAILVTGDTAPDQLRDALARGLRLLHKPVSQAGLEQAIQQALAAAADADPLAA